MYYISLGIPFRGSREREKIMTKQEVKKKVKLLCLAVCSLGIWVFLSAFISASWVGIVFGIITTVLALVGAGKSD